MSNGYSNMSPESPREPAPSMHIAQMHTMHNHAVGHAYILRQIFRKISNAIFIRKKSKNILIFIQLLSRSIAKNLRKQSTNYHFKKKKRMTAESRSETSSAKTIRSQAF
jgi:hypothetical protein